MKTVALLLLIFFCCKVDAQHRIDTTLYLQIGGIKQVVSLKGDNRRMPLLLYLHGGPGNSVAHYADKFTKQLQKHFIVAHWDQRNSGRTHELNADTSAHNAHRFRDDAYEVVDELLKLFSQEKLYVAGHSWGTYLGFQLAKNRPHMIHAYFSICPMINQPESERIAFQLMVDKATKENNQSVLTELAQVNIPFENGEQLYLHRKWLLNYTGSKAVLPRQHVIDWATMWLDVFNHASEEILFETMPTLECPVYFFLGRKDIQTNSTIAAEYYKRLTAPKKNLFWFERSGHSLPTTEPDKFQQLIIGLKEVP